VALAVISHVDVHLTAAGRPHECVGAREATPAGFAREGHDPGRRPVGRLRCGRVAPTSPAVDRDVHQPGRAEPSRGRPWRSDGGAISTRPPCVSPEVTAEPRQRIRRTTRRLRGSTTTGVWPVKGGPPMTSSRRGQPTAWARRLRTLRDEGWAGAHSPANANGARQTAARGCAPHLRPPRDRPFGENS
jgi:hypothetical protein